MCASKSPPQSTYELGCMIMQARDWTCKVVRVAKMWPNLVSTRLCDLTILSPNKHGEVHRRNPNHVQMWEIVEGTEAVSTVDELKQYWLSRAEYGGTLVLLRAWPDEVWVQLLALTRAATACRMKEDDARPMRTECRACGHRCVKNARDRHDAMARAATTIQVAFRHWAWRMHVLYNPNTVEGHRFLSRVIDSHCRAEAACK